MVTFTAVIQQFQEQGEKTGWTYIELPADIVECLYPGKRQSFRVKGRLDKYPIARQALLPLGGGRFILTLNAALRKAIGKKKGASVEVRLSLDNSPMEVCPELLESLEFEPQALEFFQTLTKSHQLYFSKWIEGAKTPETKARRIAHAVNGLVRKWDYGMILRSMRAEREG